MPDFEALREEFKNRVRAASITATTEVYLVFHYEDLEGNTLPEPWDIWRASITPNSCGVNTAATNVRELHVKAILGNIDAQVNGTTLPGTRVRDVDLEIRDDAAL